MFDEFTLPALRYSALLSATGGHCRCRHFREGNLQSISEEGADACAENGFHREDRLPACPEALIQRSLTPYIEAVSAASR